MGVPVGHGEIEAAVTNVSDKSLGKGRQSLGKDEVTHLEELVGDTLQKFGYLENA